MKLIGVIITIIIFMTFGFNIYATQTGDKPMLNSLRKEHPRLIVLDSDIPSVKNLIQSDSMAKSIYDRLKQEADKIINEPPLEYKLDGPRLLGVSRRCLHRIYTLATIYRLDKDPKHKERAKKELLAVAEFKDWHPEHFLDTAEMTHAFAIGYDWLYNDLSTEERRVIREAIIQKGLNPAKEAYEGTARWKWWVNCRHNWNQVCNGGITLGALAIADEEPELCEYILNKAVESIKLAIAEFAPDGGWPEGPGYWNYATDYNVYFLAGMQTALGTDMNLSKMEGFPLTGMFRIHFASPTGLTFNFADAGSGAGSAPQMFWMAREFNQPVYSWHQRKYTRGADALNLLWFDPRGEKPENFALDAVFKGVDVAFFRSAWEDPDAIFVGFKGGDNKANHSHLDLGTFVLDALGKRWAVDLGGDNYNLPDYFGEKRWTYYRLRTEGHNTLLINGKNQDPEAASKIISFQSEPKKAFAIADLSEAYAWEANKVWRGLCMIDRSHVLIQDEIEANDPVEVVWGFHTNASINVEGQKAVLTQGNEHLAIQILEPKDAIFKIISAQPEKPQAQNEGISNLTIQLSQKVNKVMLAVQITPYRGESLPQYKETIVPLESWR